METALIKYWLLAAMNDADKAAVRPHLERREMLQGEVLLSEGEEVDVIHFPVSCQIAP